MSVEQVTAHRTTDGQCFTDRPLAYQHEMVELLKRLPDVKRYGLNLAGFQDMLRLVPGWLALVRELAEQTPDAEQKKLAGRLAQAGEKWLKEARDLESQMLKEPDPETAVKLRTGE